MNKQELLFELARTAVIEESGDGGGIIVSQQYELLARDFLEYENKLDKPYFIRKTISPIGEIVFYPEEEHSQECIVFSYDVGIRATQINYELTIIAHSIFDFLP